MSETTATTATETGNVTATSEPKLYAGKFKTVEDLESGYNAGAGIYQANQRLTAELAEHTTVPEDYISPADLTLPEEEVQPLKEIAKSANLTQKAYERLTKAVATRGAAKLAAEESQRQAVRAQVGQDKIALVTEFVSKSYPAQVVGTVMQKALSDADSFNALMAQRNASLNSSAPGIATLGVAPRAITQTDVIQARNAAIANPGNMSLREEYINLLSSKNAA